MRFRKTAIGIVFLFIWTLVTYYVLQRYLSQISSNQDLEKLEWEAVREHHKTVELMHKLRNILKSQFPHLSLHPPQTSLTIVNPSPSLSSSPSSFLSSSSSSSSSAPPLASDLENEKAQTILSLQRPPSEENGVGAPDAADVVDLLNNGATQMPNGDPIIPILVLACNRISIANCLTNLLQYRPNQKQFPIIVSQDCGDTATRNVILSYRKQLVLIEQPDQSEITVPPLEKKFKGYYKIARHYGWALNYTFHLGYEYVVIVEDDLNVAPDFYEYFLGTYKLLQRDKTLWCVSAWNDNGKANLIDTTQPELLYRTDFFPGLGWMLSKYLWEELSVKWPKSFWDDWIRQPLQRKDRACIRPEISRTRTFGKIGVSNGLFFDKHLRFIKLSDAFVPFTKMNLDFLIKEKYDNTFLTEVYSYPVISFEQLKSGTFIAEKGPLRINYTSREEYKRITKCMGLMDDFKSGVPRTAYNGIVSSYFKQRRIYLTPPNASWKGYNTLWS